VEQAEILSFECKSGVGQNEYMKRLNSTSTVSYVTALHGLAPQYLEPLDRITDQPGRRSLHSVGTNCLVVLPVSLSTVAN